MQVRFLLGPAGSGKTWRCLDEARSELQHQPFGPPLLFLTPRQATYQIERQLLDDPALPGFTRLRIVSLDRLALEILEASLTPPRLLGDEGRIMVLRALLARHHASLETFRSTARLLGFAGQLSLTLRDCQRAQINPSRLRHQANQADPGLACKLRDCALLLEAYERWLQENALSDPDALLDAATATVQSWTPLDRNTELRHIHRLWLDGFAEMTPQELSFLSALLHHSSRSTLAFCLPHLPSAERPRFDPWSLVSATYASLRARLEGQPHIHCSVERLPANPAHTRFAHNPHLAHLEQHWSAPKPFSPTAPPTTPTNEPQDPTEPCHASSPLACVACPHPEAEAVHAAREILTHVQQGGRFRETAILVRSLGTYHAILQRVLRRYDIPFFLDRRESINHHPLAELTRYVLRVLAYGWQNEDWFGALKTGLLPAGLDEIDILENESLAHGWNGRDWTRPLPLAEDPRLAQQLEALRRRLVAPVAELQNALMNGGENLIPAGDRLSQALVDFWRRLGVPQQLESWASLAPGDSRFPAIHAAVWDQLLAWADNLALAFGELSLDMQAWLPVVEAGLVGLSVGVIPPALDQVLVGAIDRSRQPDLKLLLVLGVNEGRFPASPTHPGLLSETDLRQLESLGTRLGADARRQLAHERYYGYIAFTRPSQRLVVTWSERDFDDRPQLPSPFITHLARLFPETTSLRCDEHIPLGETRHRCELRAASLTSLRHQDPTAAALGTLVAPVDSPWRNRLDRLAAYAPSDVLQPTTASSLYGSELRTSASALERFAACPFRYFVAHGLRAEERRLFTIDSRQEGSFQHEVLARFHQELTLEAKRWRDLTPAEARTRIRRAAEQVLPEFHGGLFLSSPSAAFTAQVLTTTLTDFIEVTTEWMKTYAFDPAAVELAFGTPDTNVAAWTLSLSQERYLRFHGKIDRIDLACSVDRETTPAVILDYKSGQQTLDPLLIDQGIQLQLVSYLAALRRSPALAEALGQSRVEPVGVFYVGLRGHTPRADHRDEALTRADTARQAAYQHRGRYRIDALPLLDSGAPSTPSGQFHYRFKKSGQPEARAQDLLSAAALTELLDQVEQRLATFATRILEGDVRIDPYRHGSNQACDRCEYGAVCRIDPRTHPFRLLRAARAATEPALKP